VDDQEGLPSILDALEELSERLRIVFPVHPRTRARIAEFGIDVEKLQLLDPMSYVEFLALQIRASVVITDLGGIQEETTYLGILWLTVRTNTERPITVTLGTMYWSAKTNRRLRLKFEKILEGKGKKGAIPPSWNGHAGERIAEVLRHR
jgi:UDP-N-acetylglucosamine 2-epimerase (non-hydrolysing)